MAQISVSTTAIQLGPASNGPLLLRNRGAVVVYIGFGSTVTAATGFQVDPNESLGISRHNPGSQSVWAITAAGTTTIHTLTGTI